MHLKNCGDAIYWHCCRKVIASEKDLQDYGKWILTFKFRERWAFLAHLSLSKDTEVEKG
jgi:hypothetical protein